MLIVGLVLDVDLWSGFPALVWNDHVFGAIDPLRDTCLIIRVHLLEVPLQVLSEVSVADATLLGLTTHITES